MATYITDKISYGGNTYKLQDSDALPLAGGTVTGPVVFEDAVSIDEANVGDLIATGNVSITNSLQVNSINGAAVGANPQFTDTVVTATTSGSGNAVTAISASNGALTVTKGTTFLTSHQDISGKADKSATVSTVTWDSTNKKLTKTINGTTSDVVTAAALRTELNVADGALVNQNAFSNVKVGDSTIAADTKTDTLLLVAGKDISLTPDTTNDKVTIASTTKTIHFVAGTQTTTTGTWTGNIDIDALYDGLTIAYWLPRSGSGNATLNLTLNNGSTTGAKNCYYNRTDRITTHYGAGNIIYLTYQSAANINGTTYLGWWSQAQYWSDDFTFSVRLYNNNSIKAGPNKIFPFTIVMSLPDGRLLSIVTSSSSGTSKTANTHGFLLNQILLMYANATFNENSGISNGFLYVQNGFVVDHRYSFNTANDTTNGTTASKPIYLVGTMNNGLFYLDTIKWWSQDLPTTDDGKVYIYLGIAFDYYRMNFESNHPIYHYKNGAVRLYFDTLYTEANEAEFGSVMVDGQLTANSAYVGNLITTGTAVLNDIRGNINGINISNITVNSFGVCSTAASTGLKAVTITPFTLVEGARVTVFFTNQNTATYPYLNVSNTGAKTLWLRNIQIHSNNNNIGLLSGAVDFVYYGDRWHMVGG